MVVWDLLKALKLGESLKNPEAWKSAQVLTTAIGGMLYLLLPYLPENIAPTPEVLDVIINAIVGVIVAVNAYITLASSKKVGV